MIRRLFTVTSAASLVLCVAACLLEMRNHSGSESLRRWNEGRVESDLVTQTCRSIAWANGSIRWSHSKRRLYKIQIFKPSPPPVFQGDSVMLDDTPEWTWGNPPVPHAKWQYYRSSHSTPLYRQLTTLGVTTWEVGDAGSFDDIKTRGIAFPAWWPVVICLVLPALWVLTAVRRRRMAREGLCPACGYDLRASKDLCPECGTTIPAKGEVGT